MRVICFGSSWEASNGISGYSDKPCSGLYGSPKSSKVVVPGPPPQPFFRNKSEARERERETACVGTDGVILVEKERLLQLEVRF